MKKQIKYLIGFLVVVNSYGALGQQIYYFNSNKRVTIPDTEVTCRDYNYPSRRTCTYGEPTIRNLEVNSPTINITFNQYSLTRGGASGTFSKEDIKTNGTTIDSFENTYIAVDFRWKTPQINMTLCEDDSIYFKIYDQIEAASANFFVTRVESNNLVFVGSGSFGGVPYFRVYSPGNYIVTATRTFVDGPHVINLLVVVTAAPSIDITAGDPIDKVCYYPEEQALLSGVRKVEISNTGESPTGATWSLLYNSAEIEDGIIRIVVESGETKDYLNPSALNTLPSSMYSAKYTYESEGCFHSATKDLEVGFLPVGISGNLTLEANKKEVFFSDDFNVQVVTTDPAFTLDPETFSKYGWELDDGIVLQDCKIPHRIYAKPGLKTIVFNGTVANGCVHTIRRENFLNVAGVRPTERLSAQELELLQD